MEDMAGRQTVSVPRGRHAPPLEVRLSVQRHRLFQAAAGVFVREGYAAASAESISREAQADLRDGEAGAPERAHRDRC